MCNVFNKNSEKNYIFSQQQNQLILLGHLINMANERI